MLAKDNLESFLHVSIDLKTYILQDCLFDVLYFFNDEK